MFRRRAGDIHAYLSHVPAGVGGPRGTDLTTGKLIFKESLKNNINVEANFDDSLFYYHPFNNVKVVVKKDGIELYNSYLKKWQFFKKIPSSENIFVHFHG